MTWEKAIELCGNSMYIEKLRAAVISNGLEVDVRTNVSENKVTLVNRKFELIIINRGAYCTSLVFKDPTITKHHVEATKAFNKDYDVSPCSASIAIEYFKAYGDSAIPWKDKTDAEIKRLVNMGRNEIQVFIFDACQEAARRGIHFQAGKCTLSGDTVPDTWLTVDSVFDFPEVEQNITRYYYNIYLLRKNYFPFELGWAHKNDTFYFVSSENDGFEVLPCSDPYNWTQNGRPIFPEWYKNLNYRKLDCGHWFHRGDSSDNTFPNSCRKCASRISPTGKLINEYSLKAPRYLGFLKKDKKEDTPDSKVIYFGAEIELENGDVTEASELYLSSKDYMICKGDGSLDSGFEIVTAPAVYDVHKEKAKILFDTIINRTEMQSEDSCGLHFHVSKSAQSILQIGKQLEFMYNPDNKKFICEIAGRENNTYAKMNVGKGFTYMAPDTFSVTSQERYEAINLRNPNTIEYRIFASTTEYRVFMYRLDFVRSLIDYTRPAAVSVKSLSQLKEVDTYLSFLKSEHKSYPYLAEFLGIKKPRPNLQNLKAKENK
jgi:hypothetical protein